MLFEQQIFSLKLRALFHIQKYLIYVHTTTFILSLTLQRNLFKIYFRPTRYWLVKISTWTCFAYTYIFQIKCTRQQKQTFCKSVRKVIVYFYNKLQSRTIDYAFSFKPTVIIQFHFSTGYQLS